MRDDESVWFVLREGRDPIGPMSIAKIRRGIELGKVPPGSTAAREGDGEWVPVEGLVAQATTAESAEADDPSAAASEHLADPFMTGFHPAVKLSSLPVASPASTPAPRSTAPAGRTPSRSKWTPIAVGAVVLVGAAVAGGVYLGAKRTPALSLSLPAERLPTSTSVVGDARLRDDLDEVEELPAPYVASALAEIACGGVDLAEVLPRALGKDISTLETLGVLEIPTSKRLRTGLACGEALRGGLTSDRITTVHFEDGKEQHVIHVLRTRLEQLPTALGFVRHNFSSLEGVCLRPEGAKEDCPQGTQAAAREGDRWFFGRVDAVDAFARSYTSARTEISSSGEILQTTAAQATSADSVSVHARPASIPWTLPCLRAAPVGKTEEFLAACFPKNVERIVGNVEAKVRGLAIERDLLAHASSVGFSFVLLARDADAAKEIEADLLDLARDWRAHVANNEAEMTRLIRASDKYVHDAMWQTVFDTFLRALKGITVERSGSVVRFSLRRKFEPLEAKTLREFLSTQTAGKEAAAEVVQALLAGPSLPPKALGHFVEPEVATWLTAPRSDAAACQAMRDRLVALTPSPIPPEEFGHKFELEKRFEAAACVGQPWAADWKKCLADAKDLATLSTCRPLPSLFVSALARAAQGKWKLTEVDGEARSSERVALLGSKLELVGQEIALQLGSDPSSRGASEIESRKDKEGTLVLPSQGEGTRVPVRIDGAKLRLGPLGKANLTLVFTHADFETLLTKPSTTGASAEAKP